MTLFLQADTAGAAHGFSDAARFPGNTKNRLSGAGICAGFYVSDDLMPEETETTASIRPEVTASNAATPVTEDTHDDDSSTVVFRQSSHNASFNALSQPPVTPKPAAKDTKPNIQTVVYSPKKQAVKTASAQDATPSVVREVPEVEKSLISRFLSGKNDRDILLPDAVTSAAAAGNIELRLIELTEKIDVMTAQIAALTGVAAGAAVTQNNHSAGSTAEEHSNS